ncbi:LysR family transcriptional regulator [Chryseomicrobium palamuruense]|uniref:LysR family transcriptional regulator n=1 Tax=Chryseomicrobium palamuruense TaxID=682973 RepID=A0ABV8UX67_9BACL
MEIPWMKTFCICAETLNFRKASEILHMSQPNVTVHIHRLEQSLGVALFVRQQNRVHLTPEGQLFYARSKHLLEELTQSVQDVRALAQGYTRKWILAISPLLAETILPSVIRRFTQAHPTIELQIRIEESLVIQDLVSHQEVDFGISALAPTDNKLIQHTLFTEAIHLVKAPDPYDDESGPALDALEILQSAPLFTHHHPVIWDELLTRLTHQVSGVRSMKVSQASVTKRLIQEGLGVSFLPHSIVRRELLEGRLTSVPFPLFDLPQVSTYGVMKHEGELELAFLEAIKGSYFG